MDREKGRAAGSSLRDSKRNYNFYKLNRRRRRHGSFIVIPQKTPCSRTMPLCSSALDKSQGVLCCVVVWPGADGDGYGWLSKRITVPPSGGSWGNPSATTAWLNES